MVYTPVPTKNVGNLWTAAEHNQYIRDNFAAGVPDILTTKGEIPVASADKVAGNLAVGYAGSVLVSDLGAGLGLKWDAIDRIMVKRTNLYNNSGPFYLPFEAAEFDSGSNWSVGDPTKISIPVSGLYLSVAYIKALNLQTGYWVNSAIRSGGTADMSNCTKYLAPGYAGIEMVLGGISYLTVGTYLQLFIDVTAYGVSIWPDVRFGFIRLI